MDPLALSLKPNFAERSRFKSAPRSTIKIPGLLTVAPKQDQAAGPGEVVITARNAFTPEQLQAAWNTFAEQRKKFQLEYQLLLQPYVQDGTKIIVHLLSLVQDTLLTNIKPELVAHLRETLQNGAINVVGEMREAEEKKMMYTPRDKFEYLLQKNPNLKELKERLNLDPDF